MKLIEQEDKERFYHVLQKHNLLADDFALSETDTTDPKTDEVFALTGFVVVTRKSTHQNIEYPIGDGATWVERFEWDVEKMRFGH